MDQELKEIIRICRDLPMAEWNQYQLKQDRFYHHFSAGQCEDIVKQASQAGSRLADKIRDSRRTMEELISDYKLTVRICQEKDFLIPDLVNFAQYHDGKITISKDLLETVSADYQELRTLLGDFSAYELLFYHELFHFFEEQNDVPENAGVKIHIYPLPFIRREISPDSAGEIAALLLQGAMSGFEFYPGILELAGLWNDNRDMVKQMMNGLISDKSQHGS